MPAGVLAPLGLVQLLPCFLMPGREGAQHCATQVCETSPPAKLTSFIFGQQNLMLTTAKLSALVCCWCSMKAALGPGYSTAPTAAGSERCWWPASPCHTSSSSVNCPGETSRPQKWVSSLLTTRANLAFKSLTRK